MKSVAINDISNAQSKLLSVAYDEALKAGNNTEIIYRLSCLAIRNGKIVSKGHNHSRTRIKGLTVSSFHAEVDCMFKIGLCKQNSCRQHRKREKQKGKDRYTFTQEH